MSKIKQYIATVQDFPKKGIAFRDITPVLADSNALKMSIEEMQACLKGVEYDAIAGLESRGFLFGMPMAYESGKAFLPVRKQGKLPRETEKQEYDLEYGSAVIEVHKEDVRPGMKVVLVDDLLATGGTLAAAAKLFERLGAQIVKIVVLIELTDLKGRELLKGYDVESLVCFEGE